ncbi:Phage Mu/F-like protein [Gaiella occulta]|uniref:Phage Mu/F-like protein n=1 Tax=Gaiella occulta TaxID=1002870 RepID=A0A7M2YU82_9ACTN|nr:hypothetical protein [Gaiella occulta]RDI73300.1 Phage Mu/F-like protein [Gaiella occulta]
MTVAVELLVGRELTESERAIDVVRLDRALAAAKDDLNAAIHDEMLRAVLVWVATGSPPRLGVSQAMRDVLDRLHDLGREEGWLELERLGYDLTGRRHYVEEGPSDRDVPGYLTRNLRGVEVRIEDELVRADLAGASQQAVARAVMEIPGARDIASRAISTALINGFAQTFEQNADLVSGWAYTAVLDAGTCEVCRPLDGTVYDTLDELFRVLPNFGPNPRCYGGGRCRCRAVPLPAGHAQDQRRPYSAQFELPADYSYTRGEVQDAIAAAGSLHDLPTGAAAAKVIVDHALPADNPGFYDAQTLEIHIAAAADTPAMTFLHEAGHYISHQALGQPGELSALTEELEPWRQAVGETESIRLLLALLDLDEIPAVTGSGERVRVPVDHDFLLYLLHPEEVWARSYAQWVATRSGNQTLLRQLHLDRRGLYPMQWEDDDFEPVARAIDRIMEQLGWTI